MARTPAPWVTQDPRYDLELFQAQDPRDPRTTTANILCHPVHNRPLTIQDLEEGPQPAHIQVRIHWGANATGKWGDCGVCGLRLCYFPRVGYSGQYRVQHRQQVIADTLASLHNPEVNLEAIDHKVMKAMILRTEAELKINRALRNPATPTPKPKAKSRLPPPGNYSNRSQRSHSAQASTARNHQAEEEEYHIPPPVPPTRRRAQSNQPTEHFHMTDSEEPTPVPTAPEPEMASPPTRR
jgi:hypothetical protein